MDLYGRLSYFLNFIVYLPKEWEMKEEGTEIFLYLESLI